MCCDELQPVLRYPKLSMLFEARAARLRFRMWEREGKGEVEGGGDGRGEGQENEQAANCVNKRWLF